MRVAQVRKSLTSVCDMCVAGQRVVFDLGEDSSDLSFADNKKTGEEDLLPLAQSCVGARGENHASTRNRGNLRRLARTENGGVLPFRRAGPLAVSPLDNPPGDGPARADDANTGPQLAAEAAAHPTEEDEHDPACEAGIIRARPVSIGPSKEERSNHEAA